MSELWRELWLPMSAWQGLVLFFCGLVSGLANGFIVGRSSLTRWLLGCRECSGLRRELADAQESEGHWRLDSEGRLAHEEMGRRQAEAEASRLREAFARVQQRLGALNPSLAELSMHYTATRIVFEELQRVDAGGDV